MAAQGPVVRVWDAPVRIVHWLIALSIPALWWTAEHDQLEWHRRIGYAVLGLIVFRLIWGFVGGSTARFSGFMRGPRAVLAHARTLFGPKAEPVVGHNPMGGWSVVALMTLVVAEVGLGLFSVDTDGIESGPLAGLVSFDAGRVAAHWHHLIFNGLLVLIGLHLAAISFYALVKRENLVGPMLTGRRRGLSADQALQAAAAWRWILAALVALALAVWIARGLH
jgi:cytochrome b